MEPRAKLLSISEKNKDLVEDIQEWADTNGSTFTGAMFFFARDWKRLKTKERLWELQAIR